MRIRFDDTIAAIATPLGEGSIAVIRVSGPACLSIVDQVFRGRSRLIDVGGNTVHYGSLFDQKNSLIDNVLATVFRGPHSYTGEDVVEISCHGGLLVTRLVLESILQAGARQADPGEFTKRAFLNGKMDLAQAEAVADLIAARSQKAHAVSLGYLEGALSQRLRSLKAEIVEACSMLELELDFADEGISFVSRDHISLLISKAHSQVLELIQSYKIGRVYRDGALVVLVGKPNSGKSSLFNCLLLEDRAIVSHKPGTTRDFIEEQLVIDGIPFRIVDTAGIRNTDDDVEGAGVRRTSEIIRKSDLVLEVIDVTMETVLGTNGLYESTYKSVRVLNKSDLLYPADRSVIRRAIETDSNHACLISAITGEGICDLKKAILSSVFGHVNSTEETILVTSRRQLDALTRCDDCLQRAQESISSGVTNEFISFDLRKATDSLSEILGEITTEEILNSVFGRFCIGK